MRTETSSSLFISDKPKSKLRWLMVQYERGSLWDTSVFTSKRKALEAARTIQADVSSWGGQWSVEIFRLGKPEKTLQND